MTDINRTVTALTRSYMAAHGLTQSSLAPLLGMAQQRLSARLRGETRWTLSDVDKLRAIGVDVRLDDLEVAS